jgi:predicted AAA+ superfamily ATPase
MKQSLAIPKPAIRAYLQELNPWWVAGQGRDKQLEQWPRRAYFDSFMRLVSETQVRRAVVLIGPRRVGKTVMLMQAIQHLMNNGVAGSCIMYAQLDVPIFAGESLDSLVRMFADIHRHTLARESAQPLWIFFDEIQYLQDWESHLKVLVDLYPHLRFVATGSAAATLNRKSKESGAGRFTDFVLPPLTFAEYLNFCGRDALVRPKPGPQAEGRREYIAPDIDQLNDEFVNYLNYGGFPEAVMNEAVRQDPRRYLRQDIVDKVLQKDLPSLFGISNTQELNRFFNVLAYNTGNEVSPKSLCESSNLDHAKLNEFLEYLESAYLVKRVYRIDENARRMKRVTSFKVYLTNPSIRAALFGPVRADDEAMGRLVETAIWSQWLHSTSVIQALHYARWRQGRTDLEVDLVGLKASTQKPWFAVEIKWSDRPAEDWREWRALRELAGQHALARPPMVTTKTWQGQAEFDGNKIVEFCPSSLHCYTVARNLLDHA